MKMHAVAKRSVLVIVIVVVVLGGIGAAGGTLWYLSNQHHTCIRSEKAWDNKHDAWIVLTEPTPFPSSTSPGVLAARQARIDQLMGERTHLLAGLGPRPTC